MFVSINVNQVVYNAHLMQKVVKEKNDKQEMRKMRQFINKSLSKTFFEVELFEELQIALQNSYPVEEEDWSRSS